MYRVSIELYKHEWKFGRTRNAVGKRAAGECFHSFFEFSKLSREKEKQLVNFDYQNVNSLCSRHDYVNSAR